MHAEAMLPLQSPRLPRGFIYLPLMSSTQSSFADSLCSHVWQAMRDSSGLYVGDNSPIWENGSLIPLHYFEPEEEEQLIDCIVPFPNTDSNLS